MINLQENAYYIGIMTGNSMDAIDIVYAAVSDRGILPIYTYSVPFSTQIQRMTADMREKVKRCHCRSDVEQLPFFHTFHALYIAQIANAVADFIYNHNIDLSTLKAVCSHGKTLDHRPRSINTPHPYTLQVGSGKMLADEIAHALKQHGVYEPVIRVIYDFRSDDIMNGGEGAPLIPPLNAIIAKQEGYFNRIDINGGNTSNLSLIQNGQVVAGWDIGPCNEYMDYLVRLHTQMPFDKDGTIALKGKLDTHLLNELWQIGSDFYTTNPPKSGDPAYYHTQDIYAFSQPNKLADNLYTCAYFAAYIIVHSLHYVNGIIPHEISLFGGGWQHPLIIQSFQNILNGNGYILPYHTDIFRHIFNRFSGAPHITIHPYGQWIESLLWCAMGYYYDKNLFWTTPTLTGCMFPTICGIEAISDPSRSQYDDFICRAYKN